MPQEKLFNQIDDKYYFVVWRGNKNNGRHIVKFKNNEITIKIDNFKGYKLVKHNYGMRDKDLYIRKESGIYISSHWESDNGNYFKSGVGLSLK